MHVFAILAIHALCMRTTAVPTGDVPGHAIATAGLEALMFRAVGSTDHLWTLKRAAHITDKSGEGGGVDNFDSELRPVVTANSLGSERNEQAHHTTGKRFIQAPPAGVTYVPVSSLLRFGPNHKRAVVPQAHHTTGKRDVDGKVGGSA